MTWDKCKLCIPSGTLWLHGRWPSFFVLCFQYQVFLIQQLVQQQRTEEPTYEVEEELCTILSGRLLLLPTFQLTEGECPFLLLSFCHLSLFGLSFTLSLIQWQVLNLCAQSQRSSACKHRLTAITYSPTSTACWINQRACSKTCAFARTNGKWLSIWPCTVVWLSEAVFAVEWEVFHLNLNWNLPSCQN